METVITLPTYVSERETVPVTFDEETNSSGSEFRESLLKYYEVAGPDYQAWSKDMNMHFGYYKWGVNPFKREQMLAQMNNEVISCLEFSKFEDVHILDMGCGFAATSRFAAKHHPNWQMTGITIVDTQVKFAEKLAERDKVAKQVNIVPGDYTDMPFRSHSFDGIYAIESSCHAAGSSKHDFIKEMSRVLKPGRKFVVADVFRKHDKPLKGFMARSYRSLCDCWALTDLAEVNAFVKELKANGMTDIEVRDISWNVAPSVAHVPFVISKFLFQEIILKGLKLKKERWNNVTASFLSIILGMSRKKFSYYIISGRKDGK